jgi:hypothetical protein
VFLQLAEGGLAEGVGGPAAQGGQPGAEGGKERRERKASALTQYRYCAT